MTKLGFVIVNYNDYPMTKRLLENIKDYKCLSKIVVVDNHSTDDSVIKLQKHENKKITILEAKDNKGYAVGLNLGAKYLIKELGKCNIIFSNSDIIIHKEEDLKKLNSDIGKHSIAIVGPTIEDEIKFNLPLISRKYRKEILYDEDHFKEELSIVGVVSGCFFCVDGEVLKKVGYFDENTFLYYEEQIMAKKLEKVDKQEAIDNEVVIIHDHSVTIDKNVKKINKYKMLKESQRYFVKEYLNANEKELKRLDRTNKLSLIILYIRCFFKGGLKK